MSLQSRPTGAHPMAETTSRCSNCLGTALLIGVFRTCSHRHQASLTRLHRRIPSPTMGSYSSNNLPLPRLEQAPHTWSIQHQVMGIRIQVFLFLSLPKKNHGIGIEYYILSSHLIKIGRSYSSGNLRYFNQSLCFCR